MKSKGLGLKIVIGLMLLVLILFISSSLLAAKATYTNEITVNKPIALVFEKLTDSNFIPKWNPIAKSVTVEKGTASKVGSVFLIKANQMNKGFQVKQTIKAYTPNTDFTDELDVENMISTNVYHLESVNGATKITKTTTLVGKDHFIRWVTKIYKSKFKTAEQKTLASFKKALEK
jgi:uncharacterized protein YndB with AHSA1/START domain